MESIATLLFVILTLCVVIITYQDFMDRLVSLWVLLIFSGLCLTSVLYNRGADTLLSNGLFTLLYIIFLWVVLKLYLYIRYKRNVPIIDHQFGIADIIVISSIGLTFNITGLILFFCTGFIFSLLSFIIYTSVIKKNNIKSIPLAGLLACYYLLALVILYSVDISLLVDCSFINL
jgi:hypothetical protein